MINVKVPPNIYLGVFLSFLMLLLTAFENSLFPLLSLDAISISQGELWRLLTANLVHFGWAHTLMNAAALLLCTLAFFTTYSLKKFSFLLLWCGAMVGIGIYWF